MGKLSLKGKQKTPYPPKPLIAYLGRPVLSCLGYQFTSFGWQDFDRDLTQRVLTELILTERLLTERIFGGIYKSTY